MWGALLLLGALSLGSCDEPQVVDECVNETGADVRRGVLQMTAESLILPAYRDFESAAQALESATANHAADPSTENREAAQQAWIAAME